MLKLLNILIEGYVGDIFKIFSTIVLWNSVDFALNINAVSTINRSLLSYETAYNGKSVDNISDVMELFCFSYYWYK